MPTYSYFCNNCMSNFELFFQIKNYEEKPKCTKCHTYKTERRFIDDVATQSSSVKKSDTELKTLGDLAMRNTERMSEDEKIHMHMKHNKYKEDNSDLKQLPSGMNRIKKPPKVQWPGVSGRKKRRDIKK